MRLQVLLLVLLFLSHACWPVVGQELRDIEFPNDSQNGVLEVFSKDPDLTQLYNQESQQFPASGSIEVASDSFVFLKLGQVQDLSYLKSLPTESIQALELWNRELNHETLTCIAALSDLRLLRLEQCSFESDTFDGIAALPKLEFLSVRAKAREDRSYVPSLLQWVAAHSELTTLYASPSINATELAYLEGHPSLEWLSVELNKDREAIILRMLGELPALRSLTLIVDSGVSPRALDRVGSLSQLEELSIFSCEVDGPLIDEISKCTRLWKLRLANFQAGSGFTEALPKLTSLRHITVSHGLWRGEGQRQLAFNKALTDAQLELPNLQEGLKINTLTKEIWEELLSNAERWRELRIEGVDQGFNNELLQDLPRFKNLELLTLSNVPLQDDDLRWLQGLDQLRELTLFMTEVTGPGMKHLAALTKLRQLWLAMNIRDAEPDLVHVREVTQLRDLQVTGFGFTSAHYKSLSESRMLKKLVLQEGQIDDSVAAELSSHPSLRILSFDGSHMTDAGLEHLAEISSLRELTGKGAFTVEGVEHLGKLTNLSRLYLRSQKFSEADCERLPRLFSNVGNLGFQQ